MRIIGVLLAAAFALAATFQTAAANDYYGKQKVVYHVNTAGGDGDRGYLVALTNIRNHIAAVGAGIWNSKWSCMATAWVW